MPPSEMLPERFEWIRSLQHAVKHPRNVTMTTATNQTPFAETLWRAISVIPTLGLGWAEASRTGDRHPVAIDVMRRWHDELRTASESQLVLARAAVTRAGEAAQRVVTARDPLHAFAAQIGLSLALAGLAAAPLRAWLDALPKLEECCLALTETAPHTADRTPEPTTAGASATRTRRGSAAAQR